MNKGNWFDTASTWLPTPSCFLDLPDCAPRFPPLVQRQQHAIAFDALLKEQVAPLVSSTSTYVQLEMACASDPRFRCVDNQTLTANNSDLGLALQLASFEPWVQLYK